MTKFIKRRGRVYRHDPQCASNLRQLRIPNALYCMLIDAASQSHQSLSEEVQQRLEQSFGRQKPCSQSAERLSEFLIWTANVVDEPIERSHHARLCLEAALLKALDHLSPVPPLPNDPSAAREEAATRAAYVDAGRQLGDKLRVDEGVTATVADVRKLMEHVELSPEMRAAMSIRVEQLRRVGAHLTALGEDD